MKIRFAVLLLFLLIAGDAVAQTRGINAPEHADKPYVVLVSFDGFRHDYLGRPELKNFARLMQEGTTAQALIPGFPTKTFPTHITMVTGMSPGHHGIVANRFFDPERNARYKSSPPEVQDGSWYRGEAIWATAKSRERLRPRTSGREVKRSLMGRAHRTTSTSTRRPLRKRRSRRSSNG